MLRFIFILITLHSSTRIEGASGGYGSGIILRSPTSKKDIKFTDPVDIRPAAIQELTAAQVDSRADSKPHRYLEPEVNEGRPSEIPYAPALTSPPTSDRQQLQTETPRPFPPVGDSESNVIYDGKNYDRERLTTSASSATRGSSSYYDVRDAEKHRRERLTRGRFSNILDENRSYGRPSTSDDGWRSTSSRNREPSNVHGGDRWNSRPANDP
ncbi:MAG: hypothetical protein MUF31_13365 [Akkermansiaceae bacterium]|nr:hypothetical protein [Akkermansiaceae bacterium]